MSLQNKLKLSVDFAKPPSCSAMPYKETRIHLGEKASKQGNKQMPVKKHMLLEPP